MNAGIFTDRTMWFLQHRNSLIIVGVAAAGALTAAVGGPEELLHALAGALCALVAMSLFDQYERPKR